MWKRRKVMTLFFRRVEGRIGVLITAGDVGSELWSKKVDFELERV